MILIKKKISKKVNFCLFIFSFFYFFFNIFLFKNQQQLFFFFKFTTLVNVYFKTGSFDSFFKHVKSVVTIFMAKTKNNNNNNISFILLKNIFIYLFYSLQYRIFDFNGNVDYYVRCLLFFRFEFQHKTFLSFVVIC